MIILYYKDILSFDCSQNNVVVISTHSLLKKKDIMLRILFINYSSMVSVKNNISCLGGTWLVPFYYRRLYPQQEDHQYWCCKILHKFLFPLNTYSSSTNNCQRKKWRFHLWIINVLIRLSTEFNVEWKNVRAMY